MADFRKTSYKAGRKATDYYATKKAATAAKRADIIAGIRTGQISIVRSAGGRRLQRAMNARTGGLLGMELKFLDESQNVSLTAPTDASGGEVDPTANCIGCPAQGDGASNRDGRAYVVKSILVQGVLNVPAQTDQTAADSATTCYVALVQDQQTNGAQLNSEDVFSNPVAAALSAPQCFRNMSFITRFKVLDWCKHTLQQPPMSYDGTNIEQGGVQQPFSLKFTGAVKVNCSGTTQNVNQVQDNSFHLIAYCSNTGLAPVLQYNVRTRFLG